MQTVTIEVAPSGDTKVSVAGVKGRDCRELTAALEKALGAVESRKLTAEHYQKEARHARLRN